MKRKLFTWIMLVAMAWILAPSAKVEAESTTYGRTRDDAAEITLGEKYRIEPAEGSLGSEAYFTFTPTVSGEYVLWATPIDTQNTDFYDEIQMSVYKIVNDGGDIYDSYIGDHDFYSYGLGYYGCCYTLNAGENYLINAGTAWNDDCTYYMQFDSKENYVAPNAYDASSAIPVTEAQPGAADCYGFGGKWFTFTATEKNSYHFTFESEDSYPVRECTLYKDAAMRVPMTLEDTHSMDKYTSECWVDLEQGQTCYINVIEEYNPNVTTVRVERSDFKKDFNNADSVASQTMKKHVLYDWFGDASADTSGNAIVNKWDNFWTKFWGVLFNHEEQPEADESYDGLFHSWKKFWESFTERLDKIGQSVEEYADSIKESIVNNFVQKPETTASEKKENKRAIDEFSYTLVGDVVLNNKVRYKWKYDETTDTASCTAFIRKQRWEVEEYDEGFVDEWWGSEPEYFDADKVELMEEGPSSCASRGYKTYRATVTIAGVTSTDEHTFMFNELGHQWDDGEITTPATATAKGIKTYTCSVCHVTKVVEISPTEGIGNVISQIVNDEDADQDAVNTAVESLINSYDSPEEMLDQVSLDDLMALDKKNKEANDMDISTYSFDGVKSLKVEGISLTVSAKAEEKLGDAKDHYNSYGYMAIDKADLPKGCELAEDSYAIDISLGAHYYPKWGDPYWEEHNYDLEDYYFDDIEPAAPIRISMLIPSAMEGKDFTLYHYTKDNELEVIEYSKDGDYITFVVTSLSPYIFAPDSSEEHVHNYVETIKAATCTQSGLKTLTCSVCGDVKTEIIPVLGHDYEVTSTEAATCTSEGVKTSTCSVCGDVKTETIPATGHNYEETSTEAARCTSEGVKTSTCSVCGDVKTETIPATGHNYVVTSTEAARCTSEGVKTSTCSGCGDVKTESIPATGHNYVVTSTEAATCAKEGVKTSTCSRCGDVKTESIPKDTSKHVGPMTIVNAKAATYDAVGYTGNQICSACKAVIKAGSTIEKLKPVANKIKTKLSSSTVTKTYYAKAQAFNIGASCLGGAKITYKSNNAANISVNAAGKVTIKAKYMGKATITITSSAVTGYTPTTIKITVNVVPTKTTLSSVSNVKGKKMLVKWKKNAIGSGYQIQYSTNSKFKSGNKLVTIGKNSTVKATISKLVKGKTYYVRIRTYRKTKTGTMYSAFGAIKKVTIKK